MEFLAEQWHALATNWQLVLVLALTGVAVFLFIFERFRLDVVALLVMATLLIFHIITPREGLSGFSNEATVTIAAMFVLSAGLRRTGAVRIVGTIVSTLFERNFYLAIAAMMLGVGIMSAFINNTAVVAVLMPLMMQSARDAGIHTSRVLMPLSFAAMFGGVCTLVGTSTNLVVSSVLEQHHMEPIGMFEMAPLGVIFFAAGLVYMLTIGDKLIPIPERATSDFVESFELSEYVTDFELTEESTLVGKNVDEGWLGEDDSVRVLEVFRDNHPLEHPSPALRLRPGDVVRIRGPAETIHEIENRPKIEIRPFSEVDQLEARSDDIELVEAVIAPNEALDGRSLREVDFPTDFPGKVVAIRRQKARFLPGRERQKIFHTDLRDQVLRAGDVLLMHTDRQHIPRLQASPAFIVVSELGVPTFRTEKTIPAILIVLGVVLSAAFGIWHISVSATAGCVLLLLFGIVTIEEAYEDINWEVIFLLAGLLPLGLALEKTGGIDILSGLLTDTLGSLGPSAVLAGLYLTTALLTAFMSNQATAILFAPIAIDTAQSIGVDPRPLVLAVAFAASASFITPVGYQTNTLIYGAGQYRFSDFFRVGTGLTLLFWGIAVYFMPVIWPFS